VFVWVPTCRAVAGEGWRRAAHSWRPRSSRGSFKQVPVRPPVHQYRSTAVNMHTIGMTREASNSRRTRNEKAGAKPFDGRGLLLYLPSGSSKRGPSSSTSLRCARPPPQHSRNGSRLAATTPLPSRILHAGDFMRTFSISSALLCALALLPSAAAAQDTLAAEYAVKFVCGRPTTVPGPVAPGEYFTAINVHNPALRGVAFRWKLALTRTDTLIIGVPPTPSPGPISAFMNADLGPDQSLEIDCRHIVPRAQPLVPATGFFKGFVVIQPRTGELDVVAVYTAAGGTRQIETMEVERVEARRTGRVP
jgi:hypothetical protein